MEEKGYLISIILLISIIGISVFINVYQWNLLTQVRKCEYYSIGDGYQTFYATIWTAQTFTTGIAHSICFVRLKMFRMDDPGTLMVSIRTTDINGKPTGEDLTTGTINANTFTTSSPGEWYQITFTSQLHLSASTQYAIVVRVPYFEYPNGAGWGEDYTSPSYFGGTSYLSSDSGLSWKEPSTATDHMFEVWG